MADPDPEGYGMAAERGLSLAGVYMHFGPMPDDVSSWRMIEVYRTEAGTFVFKAPDDPDGRVSMIFAHMTYRESAMMMECIGAPVVPERKTA